MSTEQTQSTQIEVSSEVNYETIIKRLAEIESTLTLMKKLYEEKEQLTLALNSMIGVGKEVQHGDYLFTVVDSFAEKNVVFRPAAVRRFDLAIDSVMARQIKADKVSIKKVK